MKFVRIQALNRHLKIHTGEKPLACKYCPATFRAHMTLAMHQRTHTGERPYSCQYCNQNFIGRPALNVCCVFFGADVVLRITLDFILILQTHLKKHHPEEYIYHCEICDGRYKTEQTLKDHIEKKHGIKLDYEVETQTVDS